MDGAAGCWWASEFWLQGLQSGGHRFRLGPNQHSPCKQCPWLATKTARMLSITSGRLGFVQLWQRCWCMEGPCVCERPRGARDRYISSGSPRTSELCVFDCLFHVNPTYQTHKNMVDSIKQNQLVFQDDSPRVSSDGNCTNSSNVVRKVSGVTIYRICRLVTLYQFGRIAVMDGWQSVLLEPLGRCLSTEDCWVPLRCRSITTRHQSPSMTGC